MAGHISLFDIFLTVLERTVDDDTQNSFAKQGFFTLNTPEY